MKDLEIIREGTTESERLIQLAEECMELGHAAIKLVRAMEQCAGIQTPVYEAAAREDLMEEVADVLSCIEVAIGRERTPEVGEILARKCHRWAERIRSGHAGDGHAHVDAAEAPCGADGCGIEDRGLVGGPVSEERGL